MTEGCTICWEVDRLPYNEEHLDEWLASIVDYTDQDDVEIERETVARLLRQHAYELEGRDEGY